MPVNRLTVLGDSFSEGWGDQAPDGSLRGWVSRFAELMELPAGSICNLGQYGSTTQRVVDRQLPRVLHLANPLVVAVVGVNDLLRDYEVFDADRFRRNIRTIFGSLTGVNSTVVTATYPDIPGNLLVSDQIRHRLRQRFAEASAMLEEMAAEAGVECVDLHQTKAWQDPQMWSSDRLHPGPLGHQHFAETVVGLLAESFGSIAA